MPILQADTAYTFSKIFELKAPPDELIQELGYRLVRADVQLPQYLGELDRLERTRSAIEEMLPYVDLSTEMARREILISGVVKDLIHYTHAQLRIEYPLKVSAYLQGNLDYLMRTHLMRTQAELLVIEAKQEDLRNGFTQLAAELMALDQWENGIDAQVLPQLVGVVTTGDLWQFGWLDRAAKVITQVVNIYAVPKELEILQRILIKVLMP
jgi:hypothetical protein